MNKELFYIETVNNDNVILSGYYSGKRHNKCILYIPGLGSSYESSNIAKNIFKYSNNYDFLCGLNQGSGIITELFINDNFKSIKNGGAAYEDYNNWFSDIDAWISYLDDYDNIIVVAHSLGCNKIIDYLNKKVNSKILRLILLSPQDISYLVRLNKHSGMLDEALKNKDNKQNKLLSSLFLGFCYLSINTFLDFYYNDIINNIPYLSTNNFDLIKNINCDIDIIIGSNDKLENIIDNLEKMCVECNINLYVIKDADHNYRNKEKELIDLINNINDINT